jgi:hypothetical protein
MAIQSFRLVDCKIRLKTKVNEMEILKKIPPLAIPRTETELTFRNEGQGKKNPKIYSRKSTLLYTTMV